MIYDLLGSVGYQLTTATRVNEREIDRVLAERGLTRMMWGVLVALGANSLSQPSRIADFMGVDRPTVSRALGQLEKAGFVERSSTSYDGRQITVAVTKAGMETLRAAAPEVRNCNERFLSSLTPEEQLSLAQILMKLNADRPSLKGI